MADSIADHSRCRIFEDFHYTAGVALPAPWGKQDTSAAGSPTTDFVASSLGGNYLLQHSSTNEAQALTLYFADHLIIDPTKNTIFEARLKINFDAGQFSADQRIVVGLASARNATLDNVAQHAWFRVEGANLNVLWETDDGSTDDDDNDSGMDLYPSTVASDDIYVTFRVDLTTLTDIGFYFNGVKARDSTASAAFTASHKMQPFIEIQKDAGAETEAVTIDYVLVEWDRI